MMGQTTLKILSIKYDVQALKMYSSRSNSIGTENFEFFKVKNTSIWVTTYA